MPKTLTEILEACEKATSGKLSIIKHADGHFIYYKEERKPVVIGDFFFLADANLYIAAREELPRLVGVLKEIVKALADDCPHANLDGPNCLTCLHDEHCGVNPAVIDILNKAGIRP